MLSQGRSARAARYHGGFPVRSAISRSLSLSVVGSSFALPLRDQLASRPAGSPGSNASSPRHSPANCDLSPSGSCPVRSARHHRELPTAAGGTICPPTIHRARTARRQDRQRPTHRGVPVYPERRPLRSIPSIACLASKCRGFGGPSSGVLALRFLPERGVLWRGGRRVHVSAAGRERWRGRGRGCRRWGWVCRRRPGSGGRRG